MRFNFALRWLVHYSDDFLLVSGTNLELARKDLARLVAAFKDLKIPLANDKILGLSCCMVYLGIEFNSVEQTISIPEGKYTEIMDLLPQWVNKRTCTKQQFLSLVRKLSFVSKVIRPGRIFLRRFINLSTTVRELHHHITLTKPIQEDIKWWLDFLPGWNQKSIIPESDELFSHDIRLFTDASNIGFGAIYYYAWIQSGWNECTLGYSIDFNELFAIVAAAQTWSPYWVGKRIAFVTDNLPITQVWDTGSTKSQGLMPLVRKLFLIAAREVFSVSLKHIFGVHNPIADAISRFQVAHFRQLMPHADLQPTPIPEAVWNYYRVPKAFSN